MSGIGMAYKLPEDRTASVLDASARAVTQPPAAPGIGMASPGVLTAANNPTVLNDGGPEVQVPAPAPEPAPAPAPEQKQKPLIDWHENPLGAIGLVLSSAAAGYNGTESPVTALKKEQLERQAFEYKQAGLALDIVDKTGRFVAKLPAGQRKDAIADLDQRFSGALGGRSIAPFLTAMTAGDEAQAKARMDALKGLNLSPAMMAYFGSDPEAAVKFIDNYNQHQATKESPEEAAAKAKAIALAQGEAGAVKPPTPTEIAADKRAREANAASQANAAATREAAIGGRKQSQENTLRGEFTTQAKEFIAIRNANQKIKQASRDGAKDKTGATDMSLVFSYMKLLDPTSTVREGEYASAANSGGVGEKIRNLYNAAAEGKVLSETQRKDFATQANRMYLQAEKNHISLVKDYTGKATNTGADPSNVIVDYIGLPHVQSDADFAKLPKGAEFIDPDGNHRKKP
jgi:hypothetical protein